MSYSVTFQDRDAQFCETQKREELQLNQETVFFHWFKKK